MYWSEVLASSFLPRKRVENHWKIRLKMASDSDLRSSCDHIRITPFSTCAHMIFTPYSECHTQQAGIHWYEVDGSKSNMNTELFFFLIPLVQSLSFRQQNNLKVTNTDLTLWSQLLMIPDYNERVVFFGMKLSIAFLNKSTCDHSEIIQDK